ncbi:MAG: YtxH domain-containing protein [Actinomycetota bacterium]
MRKSGLFSNFILIFGLGFLLGILFAPRAGDKTRKILAEKFEEGCGSLCTNLTDRVAMLKGRMQEYLNELKEKAEEVE